MRPMLLLLVAGCVVHSGAPATQPRVVVRHAEPAPVAAVDRALTRAEQNVMAGLQAAAVEVRRLPFVRPVVTRVRNAASITEELSAKMEEDDLAEASEIYEALGLLPEGTDVRALLEGVLGEQVVGYYDPDSEEMVIRDDVMDLLASGGPAAREPEAILVHELVHALQDQHYDLGALYEDDERSNDASGALRSLVEGDATLAMVAHGAGIADVQLLAGNIAGNVPSLEEMMVNTAMPQGGMSLSQAPAIVRATLVVPYLAGLSFCAYWARQGGWDAVDAQFANLPRSTEQVLHPEKSAAREEPIAITLPELALEGEILDEATIGELEMAVYFGQGRASGVDSEAAAGWAGDAVRIIRGGPLGTAVVWLTLWDDESEAIEAAAAANRVGAGVSGGHVHRDGRVVVILRRVPPRKRGAVVQALVEAGRQALVP